MQSALDQPAVASRVARRLQTSRQNLQGFIEQFAREPLRRAGIKPPETLSVQQLWAVAVARYVRLQKLPYETAEAVYAFLANYNGDELEADFAEGRSCIFLVNSHFMPRLFRPEDLFSAEIKQLQHDSMAIGHQVKLLRIDVRPLLQQIMTCARTA